MARTNRRRKYVEGTKQQQRISTRPPSPYRSTAYPERVPSNPWRGCVGSTTWRVEFSPNGALPSAFSRAYPRALCEVPPGSGSDDDDGPPIPPRRVDGGGGGASGIGGLKPDAGSPPGCVTSKITWTVPGWGRSLDGGGPAASFLGSNVERILLRGHRLLSARRHRRAKVKTAAGGDKR